MSIKKIPMRTCVACRTNRPKRELIRVVRTMDGSLVVDRRGKVSGRGAYLCPSSECVERALKAHTLERCLERSLTDDVIEELRRVDGAPL